MRHNGGNYVWNRQGRSFFRRSKVPRLTFTPLPATVTPSKEVHPVHRLSLRTISSKLSYLRAAKRFSPSTLPVSESLPRHVLPRHRLYPAAETQVRELESVRLDNIEGTDTLAHLEFPFAWGSRSFCFVQRNCDTNESPASPTACWFYGIPFLIPNRCILLSAIT